MLLFRTAAAIALVCAACSGARAADLPSRVAPPVVAPVLPAFTWTGFYVGVNAGAGFGLNRGSFTDSTFGAVTSSGDGNAAFIGGGQVGFNYQFTPGSGFVVGLEADIQGVAGGARPAYAIGGVTLRDVGPSLDYLGTVRGRIGYAFDRLLVYGTAGFAYGGGSLPAFASSYAFSLPSTTATGYAAGAGIEYALTTNISAKVEGLYVHLNHGGSALTSFDATTAAFYGNPNRNDGFGLLRAGLNYRF